MRYVVLTMLAAWAERGWIRRLDAALARFVAMSCRGDDDDDDGDDDGDGVVPLATALVAHLEGQGHTCLVLDDWLADPARSLRWVEPAQEALDALLLRLPREVDAWVAALMRCPAVGDGDDGTEPLVLHDRRLYLRRYWRHERRVAERIGLRVGAFEPVDEVVVRGWLDRLFPEPVLAGRIDWQKVACAIALRGRLSIVTGGPGTGKTFTAARFLALLLATAPDPDRLRVALAAPTGKAAARLKQSIDQALDALLPRVGTALPLAAFATRVGPAKTLHAWLGTRRDTRRFRHDAASPLNVDVVIVDEASMVHVEMMDALLDALPPRARVLLLGDKDQLASVEAGAVLGELCRDADAVRYGRETARYIEATTGERVPEAAIDSRGSPLAQQVVVLRDSRRFGGDIGALARAVNAGDGDGSAALLTARTDGAVAWMLSSTADAVVALARDGRSGAPGGYRRYLEIVRQRPLDASADTAPAVHAAWVRDVLDAFEGFRVLCAVRDGAWGVTGLNRAIADALTHAGLLSTGSDWYEGRPVIVTRNDRDLGVFNGDIGVVLRGVVPRGVVLHGEPPASGLRAWFSDGATLRSVGVGRLNHVETAFAMTVHKAQGSEFDHTVLVLPPEGNPVTTRELTYTGITRARSTFTLVTAHRASLVDALAQTTRRSSGLLGFVEAMRGD